MIILAFGSACGRQSALTDYEWIRMTSYAIRMTSFATSLIYKYVFIYTSLASYVICSS